MTGTTLAQALSKLDSNNDNHWTADNLPRLETVKMITGDASLTLESILEQFPDFKRQTAGVVIDSVVISPPVITPPVVIVKENLNETQRPTKKSLKNAIKETEKVLVGIDAEKEVLLTLEKDYYLAKAAYENQLAIVDKLISDSQNDLTPASDTQQSIKHYHAAQLQVLQSRQAKLTMIKDSGIDLKLLADDLRAPIDRPKARRS